MSKGNPTHNIRWPEKQRKLVEEYMERHKIEDFGAAVRQMVVECATLTAQSVPHSEGGSVPRPFDAQRAIKTLNEYWDTGAMYVVTTVMMAHWAQVAAWLKEKRVLS